MVRPLILVQPIKNYSTGEVLKNLKINWPINVKIKVLKKQKFKESNLLKLNCDKAKKMLRGILNLNETLTLTTSWYKTFY